MSGDALHQLDEAALLAALAPQRVGKLLQVHDELDSTNTFVLNEVAAHGDAVDGLVVFAERQTAGRGRLGRQWECPTGAGLMFSILLIEDAASLSASAWMMLAGVVTVRAIAAATEVEPALRWPNDVYVDGRKLAGILVEGRTLADGKVALALGVGINCLQQPAHFSPDVRDRAVSLDMLSAAAVDRQRLAVQVLQSFDDAIVGNEMREEQALAENWRAHSVDVGAHVTLQYQSESFSGRILDVHPRDGLLLQLDDGGRRLFDPIYTSRSA